MRFSNALLAIFAILVIGYFVLPVGPSGGGILETFRGSNAGGAGTAANAEHSVSAQASISKSDGYDYPGQLELSLSFTGPEGEETRYDVRYPSDYLVPDRDFGPLWLNNWSLNVANSPEISPILGNSCLQTIRGEALTPGTRYRTGYSEYIVCRVLNEDNPYVETANGVEIGTTSVVGILWSRRNQQPIEYPRDRCAAEARVWAVEVAQPTDVFVTCVIVVSEDDPLVQVHSFELSDEAIIEIGGAGESWPRAGMEARDAGRLVQYRLMQSWLTNPAEIEPYVARAYEHISSNTDKIVTKRESQFESVDFDNGIIRLTFSAKSDAAMRKIEDTKAYGDTLHIFQHIREVFCGSNERAALLAFQEQKKTLMFDLNKRDGGPMWKFVPFPSLPCG